jgi:hypothetical protein
MAKHYFTTLHDVKQQPPMMAHQALILTGRVVGGAG